MYSFDLSDQFLSTEEQQIFTPFLQASNLDGNIWSIFAALFRSGVNNGQPCLLRISYESELQGAIILVKCRKYGRALFDHRLLSAVVDLIDIPYYQWIKFGCCMDMMSNPGFFRHPANATEICQAAVRYLQSNYTLTVINDYTSNIDQYETASVLPALPHALIDCSGFASLEDYTTSFKNIKRKIKTFRRKGGSYMRIDGQLNPEYLSGLRKCFISTAKKSTFYLPYQELYLNAALETSKSRLPSVHYFVATIDGEFLGYQAAIKTGNFLNALHGAFDRSRKSTYHAYDILFVKMVEFALEENLKVCDFGAVLNLTKQKMVNRNIDMSYFILSKTLTIQKLFRMMLKWTKIQGSNQLRFRAKKP